MKLTLLWPFVLLAQPAFACKCEMTLPVCKEVGYSNAVFIGTVEYVSPTFLSRWNLEQRSLTTAFRSSTTWRGSTCRSSGSACSPDLDPPQTAGAQAVPDSRPRKARVDELYPRDEPVLSPRQPPNICFGSSSGRYSDR